MLDRLREIPKRILEWWNKFTPRMKTIIVSAVAGVVVAFVILLSLLTRPVYVPLASCETTKESSDIIELLKSDGTIDYKVSDDGKEISVLKAHKSAATILLGANNIPTSGYALENVTGGGFSTTESDKQKQYKLYLESLMETDLQGMTNVKRANVQLNLPENDGTLISKQEDSSAAIMIEPDGEFTKENAATLAKFVKTALGNTDVAKVTIIDSEGNLLFSGDEEYSISGTATGQMEVVQQAKEIIQSEVKKVLLGTNEFDLIEVSSSLDVDFSTTKSTEHGYTPAEGQSQGVLSEEDIYTSEAKGSTAGVPGTDSNGEDGTTYVIQDGGGTSSTVTEEKRNYLPNESIVEKTIPAGMIRYSNSTISVSAIKYKVLKEEDASTQGLLDGISWDEYKLANSERKRIENDDDIIDIVAKASGIPAENISFIAFEEPMFIDKPAPNVSASDIIQIIIIVTILALLAFVIMKGMSGAKTEVVEPELPVEGLLESTTENNLDDIELETKSETRKVIEKFVDENPEAAAALLRNWLNEDWQ